MDLTPNPDAAPEDRLARGTVVSERMARAAFDAAPDGIVILDAEGRPLAWNAAFLALWRFPPDMLVRRDAEEMRAHTAQQLVDPARYWRSLEWLKQANQPQILDDQALNDGRVFERHVAPQTWADGTRGLIVRWRDITARHRAEQALAHSQARLSAVVEHALNAILLASDEGMYVDANPAACDLTGYRREELLGMRVSQLVVPDSVDLDTAWRGFLQAGQSRGRVQLRCKDGRVIVATFSAKAHVLPGLNLSILSDVTDEVLAHQRLENLAQTDPLTGVNNRRQFMTVAASELARARRHGQPLALLMVDIDHFKQINDRHGHAVGDQVLCAFVQVAGAQIRQGDVLARLGGDEFVVLLPQTDAEGAAVFAQRLLQQVQQMGPIKPVRPEEPVEAQRPGLPDGQGLTGEDHRSGLGHGIGLGIGSSIGVSISISVGVATLGGERLIQSSIEDLMRWADQALYRSKAGGRGRVSVDSEATPAGT